MSPGDVSVLSLSDEVAFRVVFETPPEKPSQLYWRGPVLWEFDGRTWHPGRELYRSTPCNSRPRARRSATRSRSSRTTCAGCSPSTCRPRCRRSALLTSDYPDAARAAGARAHALRHESVPPVPHRTVDEVRAATCARAAAAGRTYPARAGAGRSPGAANPRTTRRSCSRALNMYREQPFFYTLVPPELGRDPVDEFLFDTPQRLLRTLRFEFRVPDARGRHSCTRGDRLPGRRDESDGRLPHRAPVGSTRLDRGLAGRARAGCVSTRPPPSRRCASRPAWPRRCRSPNATHCSVRDASTGSSRLRFAWDAIANSWNQWVLGYNPERQTAIPDADGPGAGDLAKHGHRAHGGQRRSSSWCWLRAVPAPGQAASRTGAARSTRILRCHGQPRRATASSEGPRDFAARVSLQFPEIRDRVQHIGALVRGTALRREDCDTDLLREFREAVRSFG